MTTKRNYECNLCRQAVGEATNPAPHKPGVGIIFSYDGINDVLCCQAENHLCLECIRGTQKLNIEPDAAPRAK